MARMWHAAGPPNHLDTNYRRVHSARLPGTPPLRITILNPPDPGKCPPGTSSKPETHAPSPAPHAFLQVKTANSARSCAHQLRNPVTGPTRCCAASMSTEPPAASGEPGQLRDRAPSDRVQAWLLPADPPAVGVALQPGDGPDSDALVGAAGGQPGAVRAERHRRDPPVAADLEQLLPAGRVPDPGAVIVAAGGQPGAVRAERHRPDPPVVADLEQLLPAGRVPDPGGVAGAGGGQPGAVRAERHRPDPPVAADFEQLLLAGRVPYPGAVIVAAGGQPGAVRAERHRPDPPVVADLEQLLPAGRVPDPGGVAGAGGGQPGAV